MKIELLQTLKTGKACADTSHRSSLFSRRGLADFIRELIDFTHGFYHDTRGIILPYVTIMLTVIVGVSVLALDGARFMSLQTQLQKGADALAIAGAAELNQWPDAITRATAAINNTNASWVVNSNLFGANVTVSKIRFFSSLPAGTTTSVSSAYETTDPVKARFVEVTVTPATLTTILPASFFGGSNNVTTQGQSVAGSDQVTCDVTPLFVCNPFEQPGMTYAQATQALIAASTDPVSERRLWELQSVQNNAGTYFPGAFGYVQPVTGSLAGGTCGPQQGNSSSVVQAMALTKPNVCVRQTGINFQTGNDQNVYEALNVRFDLWAGITGSFKNCAKDSNYSPDENVRKGMTPGNGKNGVCSPQTQSSPTNNWPPGISGKGTAANGFPAAMGFPVDNNMLVGDINNPNLRGTADQSVPYGDGNWTCGDISGATTAATPTTSTTLTLASTTGISVGMQVLGLDTYLPSNTSVFVSSLPSSLTVNVTMVDKTGKAVTANSSIPSGTSITFPGYWSTAHPAGTLGAGNQPAGCNANAPATISRYAVSQYEIANGYTADKSAGGEQGSTNMCSSTPPVTDRRILHVAMLNCDSLSVQGSAKNVPVAAFAKMFLTVPIPTKNNAPYAEFSGIDKQGDGFLYQSVQLYR